MTTAELKGKLDRELLRKLAGHARGRRSDAAAPRAAQLPLRRAEEPTTPAGPNPFLVVALAFATGVALARWLDRRGRAHPRG